MPTASDGKSRSQLNLELMDMRDAMRAAGNPLADAISRVISDRVAQPTIDVLTPQRTYPTPELSPRHTRPKDAPIGRKGDHINANPLTGLAELVFNMNQNAAPFQMNPALPKLYELLQQRQAETPLGNPDANTPEMQSTPEAERQWSGQDLQHRIAMPITEAFGPAIASIESRGQRDPYRALGPIQDDGSRALGKYQVMSYNVGPWSREALGREVSIQEFLANEAVQDAIFNHRFGQYVNKYGPAGAAQAWFGGEGGVGKLNRRDSNNKSIASYTSDFMASIGQPAHRLPEQAGSGGVPKVPPALAWLPPETLAEVQRLVGSIEQRKQPRRGKVRNPPASAPVAAPRAEPAPVEDTFDAAAIDEVFRTVAEIRNRRNTRRG